MPRHWKDQPAVLDNLSIVTMATVGIKNSDVRVYKDTEGAAYYISVGNHKESQTAICRDADTVFAVMRFIRSKRKGKILPDGVVLLKNLK